MKSLNTNIVVIHDDISNKDPLLVVLREGYGENNVVLKKHSKDGLDYVISNLSKKMIVILDLNFKAGEPSGLNVFEGIRKQTSLVYVIIWTASALEDIDREDLKSMINNDALAFMSSTDDIGKIIERVDAASHQLDIKLDSALEQWITAHSKDERDAPYILTRDGKSYTLNDILKEVRLQTPFGMQTEKDILLLAIDMLSRGKKKIDG
jgi:DNA-binding NarL/FixJ family response regulator